MSFKDMLGQGSVTEDADCDIAECLEELEAEQELAFLKEQIDYLKRNELDAEDTSVTTCRTTRNLLHAREIEMYPDSCCMFGVVAVCCDMELQSVSRSMLRWQSLSGLPVKETQATDELQEETALMLRQKMSSCFTHHGEIWVWV